MRRVADKVHIAAKMDIAYANQINSDVLQYIEATKTARDQLNLEINGWKAQAKEVNEAYK